MVLLFRWCAENFHKKLLPFLAEQCAAKSAMQMTVFGQPIFIELDDGKIVTGKPDQFDGKNPWVSGVDFPQQTNPMKYWSGPDPDFKAS